MIWYISSFHVLTNRWLDLEFNSRNDTYKIIKEN